VITRRKKAAKARGKGEKREKNTGRNVMGGGGITKKIQVEKRQIWKGKKGKNTLQWVKEMATTVEKGHAPLSIVSHFWRVQMGAGAVGAFCKRNRRPPWDRTLKNSLRKTGKEGRLAWERGGKKL